MWRCLVRLPTDPWGEDVRTHATGIFKLNLKSTQTEWQRSAFGGVVGYAVEALCCVCQVCFCLFVLGRDGPVYVTGVIASSELGCTVQVHRVSYLWLSW